MKLNCPPILFGEVWDLVSCDIISCIHVLCVWIGLSLVVKFRNCLILTQLPVFSDSSLLSSPFPDSYRIVLCPVNSHKCVGCMLINFSVYLKWIKHVSSEKHFLLSKTGFPWGVWRGPASAELFELMGMWREAPRSARPPPSVPASDPQGAPVSEGGWISWPPAFLLHVLWQIQSCVTLLFYGFFQISDYRKMMSNNCVKSQFHTSSCPGHYQLSLLGSQKPIKL